MFFFLQHSNLEIHVPHPTPSGLVAAEVMKEIDGLLPLVRDLSSFFCFVVLFKKMRAKKTIVFFFYNRARGGALSNGVWKSLPKPARTGLLALPKKIRTEKDHN